MAEICSRYDVVLIEDAAEALGATWRGGSAGNWGALAALSFNGNRITTTGGGGMLLGDPDSLARARYLAQQAREPVLHYEHREVGYNYRLSNLLAAIGRGQLARMPDKIARRHELNALYREALSDVEGIEFMPWDDRGRPNGWLTVLTLPPTAPISPHELCAALEEDDIEARPAWKPMYLQPVFAGVPVIGGEVAEDLYARGVCLPSGSAMTDADVQRVVERVGKALPG